MYHIAGVWIVEVDVPVDTVIHYTLGMQLEGEDSSSVRCSDGLQHTEFCDSDLIIVKGWNMQPISRSLGKQIP